MDEPLKLYRSAVDDYKAALDFATQPELRAEYFEEFSKAYERLGDFEGAIKVMREAVNILPEGSHKRDIFETRLDELEQTSSTPKAILECASSRFLSRRDCAPSTPFPPRYSYNYS